MTKKTKIILTVSVISIISLAYLGYTVTSSPQSQTPTWKNIVIGKDTKQDIIKKLGSPVSATENELNYNSGNQYWLNKVVLENNKASLVRERVLDTSPNKLQTYIQRLGQPEAVLPNSLSTYNAYLHVYPKQGIAINANPQAGSLFEIWYFPSTTLDTFKLKYRSEIGEFQQDEFTP
jgi:hypothetical protein